MKVCQLSPELNCRFQFSLRFLKFIPRQMGCYVLAAFDDEVLYIGLTDNLHRRFAEHRDSKEKIEPNLYGRASWFYYLTCDEKDLYRIERTWMNQNMEEHGILPSLNKVNSPVR